MYNVLAAAYGSSMPAYNEDQWTNIDPDDEYAVSKFYSRFTLLAADDPYLSFFTSDVRMRLAAIICIAIGDESQDQLTIKTVGDLLSETVDAIYQSPLAMLMTLDFQHYIAGLAVRAVFPTAVRT